LVEEKSVGHRDRVSGGSEDPPYGAGNAAAAGLKSGST